MEEDFTSIKDKHVCNNGNEEGILTIICLYIDVVVRKICDIIT